MPRLRFSTVVWLVLISQVLSLAVVATALWDFQKGISQITVVVDRAGSQSPPDTLTGNATGDPNRQRPTLKPPRVIGETNQILECITDALLARRLASRQLAGSDANSEPHSECDRPDPPDSIQQSDQHSDQQFGNQDRPPGGK